MTREDIIKLAREVDPVTAILLDKKTQQGMDHETFVWFLERFAALVGAAAVKKEREELKAEFRNFGGLKDGYSCASSIEAREMEHDAAIRARGNK